MLRGWGPGGAGQGWRLRVGGSARGAGKCVWLGGGAHTVLAPMSKRRKRTWQQAGNCRTCISGTRMAYEPWMYP